MKIVFGFGVPKGLDREKALLILIFLHIKTSKATMIFNALEPEFPMAI